MKLLHSLFCMQRTSKALMEKPFYIFHQSSGSDLAGWVWTGEIFMNGAAVGHCFRRAVSGPPSLLPSLFPKYVSPLGPFFSPSSLAVLLLLEELVDESGLSLHTAGCKMCLFFASFKSGEKRGKG